nr:acetyl-CoA carboxylase biotin carboxyl carrier protein subunit [Deltaproteobacteria bacterium]
APLQAGPDGKGNRITAPMTGTVLKLNVNPDDSVMKGQVLLILEAMKMENEIFAPLDGKVTSIHVSVGTSVNAGEALIDFDPI